MSVPSSIIDGLGDGVALGMGLPFSSFNRTEVVPETPAVPVVLAPDIASRSSAA
jgi:hypothetical protein